MTRLLSMLAVTASLFLLSENAGMAAGKSPQECAKLDREYQALLQKEQQHQLTPVERRRMHQIDDESNIYCSN
jgi:hypothetical protein